MSQALFADSPTPALTQDGPQGKKRRRNLPGVSVKDAAKALGVDASFLARVAQCQEAPLSYRDPRRAYWSRFAGLIDLKLWIAERWAATFLGTEERKGRTLGGTWAVFRPDGWATSACKRHARAESPPRRAKVGEFVLARLVRVMTSGGYSLRVELRCWCSARVGRVPLGWLPAEQQALIPDSRPVAQGG